MSKMLEILYTSGDEEPTSNSFDVTPFIVLNTYSISNQPVFDSWTDGNNHERRGLKRRKLKGDFSVKFFNQKDYQDFLSAIIDSRAEGFDYITVNIYDNKSRSYITNVNVYFDFEPINVEPSIGWSFNEEIEINVSER